MRAYVITESTPDRTNAIRVTSSKSLAISTCEHTLASRGTWVSQEKHDGEYKLGETSISYKMFMVNQ